MSANKFTKLNIQKIIQSGSNLDPHKANELTSRLIKTMTAVLAAGETIELRGFGSLEVKERKAYKARNPKTGEPLIATERRRVLFHPGQELKAVFKNVPKKDRKL
jgi:DNA-binding protein HU-beta/integration host factor subunit beta